jgi:DNA polymerase IIIc chi subunit
LGYRYDTQFVPHILTKEFKTTKVVTSIKILQIQQEQEANDFALIISRGESWFSQFFQEFDLDVLQ